MTGVEKKHARRGSRGMSGYAYMTENNKMVLEMGKQQTQDQ